MRRSFYVYLDLLDNSEEAEGYCSISFLTLIFHGSHRTIYSGCLTCRAAVRSVLVNVLIDHDILF